MRYLIFLIIATVIQFPLRADIEMVSQLDFGTIAVLDNTGVETYQLYSDGRVRTSDNILIVKNGAPAVMRVFNLDPNIPLVVSTLITNNTFRSPEPNTNTFELTEVATPILLNTDEFGEVIFNVGGTLATDADGSLLYGNSFLLAQFDVTIDF